MKHFLKSAITLVTVVLFAMAVSGQLMRSVSAEGEPDAKYGEEGFWPTGGPLNDALIETAPIEADFGGVWVADDARVKVGLVETNGTSVKSKETILDIVAEIGISEWTDIVSVQYSRATLIQTRDSIVALSQQYIKLSEDSFWPIYSGLQTNQNKVLVYIPPNEENLTPEHHAVLEKIKESYSDLVIYETYDSPPELSSAQCNTQSCDPPLRGGIYIDVDYVDPQWGYTTGSCTAGFIVKGVASGRWYLMTAGHCIPESEMYSREWRSKLQNPNQSINIGNVNILGHNLYYAPPGQGSDFVDAMIILVDNNPDPWQPVRAIYKRNGVVPGNIFHIFQPTLEIGYLVPVQTNNEQHAITQYSGSAIKDMVCISPGKYSVQPGANHGGNCGPVTQEAVMIPLPDKFYGFARWSEVNSALLCAVNGDSGSPIYHRDTNTARGIYRGGSSSPDCNSYRYFTSMRVIMERYARDGHNLTFY
jgi:hypothetical protein